MQILCLGLSHHTAPIELREKFAIPDGQLGAAALQLAQTGGIGEAVIVSTCNRVEFYVGAEDVSRGFSALEEFLHARAGEAATAAFFRHASANSIRHLFRVVCGLDSMVLGETEILGQVKKAYQTAQTSGATAKLLNKLFQRAFNVAKEVRTNTNITRGSVSVGSVAVDLAEKIFGKLARCKVMILGAGETSEMTAGALQARGVKSIFVANRSYDRAAALAEKMGGKALHFDAWTSEFHDVDILIGSTSAPHYVITSEKLAPLMRTRRDRPLFCIDLAAPRDIEPAVNDLDGVYLYDIDSLQQEATHSMDIRRQELVVCEGMIERHVAEFNEWLVGAWQAGVAYSEAASGVAPGNVWKQPRPSTQQPP
jgi:glutamyl-tRNA reductase